MLSPRQRVLLFQSLRPPPGYRFDRAIGTSYTLDLLALLTAPLAFAFHDWEDAGGQPTRDPVALLHALRGHARRIHLFCQAGGIRMPDPGQPLFTYLEPSVVEARAPREGGLFHPKVWVLRYTSAGAPVRYRVLVASRNLTFDRSWDTLLVLDGELTTRRLGFAPNRPLGDFVAALPGLALRPLDREAEAAIAVIADELRRVRFELPADFDEVRFHPLGIPGHEGTWPLAGGGRQCLVVSPFLSDELVNRLAAECEADRNPEKIELHLVSCAESLEQLRPTTRDRWQGHWVLAADAEPEDAPEEAADEQGQPPGGPDPSGLHAKLVVLHRHHRAHVFTGSANATSAAFGRNVEFVVELIGSRGRVGVSSLLGGDGDEGSGKLRELLEPWKPADPEPDPDPERELREDLCRRLETARLALGSAHLTLHASPSEEAGAFDLTLRGRLPALPNGVAVRCWPASRPPHHAVPPGTAGDLASFRALTPVELTAFLAFELEARESGLAERVRFARHLPLEGAPQDREELLLRGILKDKETVLRLLWILLSSEELMAEDLGPGNGTGPFPVRAGLGGMPLLEAMLRSLARDPEALTSVQELIEDLARSAEGRSLLPDGLDRIWEPIRMAREELRR